VEGDAVMAWRQMVLVIEIRIPCGLCREEDSPITIWKEGFKRKRDGGGGNETDSLVGAVQFEVRTERTVRHYCAFLPTVWRLRQGNPGLAWSMVNVRGL
jgi:hypothetical protein